MEVAQCTGKTVKPAFAFAAASLLVFLGPVL
jgi:hypothetical protein